MWTDALPADAVKNVVHVEQSGRVTWNDADVTFNGYRPVIDLYLGTVAGLDPQPPTVLDFEEGSSCAIVDDVRAMMQSHLRCETSGLCFQGAVRP